MRSRYLALMSLCAGMTAVITAAALPPGTDRASTTPGVLVLRNGHVLTGSMRRTGDDYFVEVDGALLTVPASQVDMFCRSVLESYERRRRERVDSSADAHVVLARWCLRVNLVDAAARELLDARTRDARHPALPGLELQLQRLLEHDAVARQPVERSRAASTAPPDTTRPTDAAPLDVATDVRAQFVRSIQPMLVHSCATGGCHQPGAAHGMQLDRWALEGKGDVELIHRNLSTVLRELTVDDPGSSPLLRMAREEHGRQAGRPSRSLTSHQASLLLAWLNQAAGVMPREGAPQNDADSGAAREAWPDESLGDEWFDEPGLATRTAGSRMTLTAAPRAELIANAGLAAVGAAPEPFVPRDPFDPEIFNRQAAARAQAESTVAERGTGTFCSEDSAK
jgi:hypothetical protein